MNALQQFFLLFPNLQKNEFFLSGVSYGAKYVTSTGYAIYEDSKREMDPRKPKINLKGIAFGNCWVDPVHQFDFGDLLYKLGLIDSNGRDSFISFQNKCIDCLNKRHFLCAYEAFCDFHTLYANLTGLNDLGNYLQSRDAESDLAEDRAFTNFLESMETRRAIHVDNNIFNGIYGHPKVMKHLRLDFMDSVADRLAELLSHYPILIYTGQLDILCSYSSTVKYLNNLNFDGADEYKLAKRKIWRVHNEIAGYVKIAGNLTEVLVRNAGKRIFV